VRQCGFFCFAPLFRGVFYAAAGIIVTIQLEAKNVHHLGVVTVEQLRIFLCDLRVLCGKKLTFYEFILR
jgi:hypothetical protein